MPSARTRTNHAPRALAFALLVGAAAASGCERRVPAPPAVCLAVPGEGPLAAGDSVRAVAGLIDTDGTCVRADPREFSWRASDAAVLEVRSDGWVIARAPGLATIAARTDRRRREETVEVIPAVDSIVIEGPAAALAVGDTTRLLAVVYFRSGRVRRDIDVAWSLRAADVLSDHLPEPELIGARVAVPFGYLVRATGPGSVWVVAAMRHHTDSLRVRVRS